MFNLKYGINPISIDQSIRIIYLMRRTIFDLQRDFMRDRYKLIYSRAYSGTMVATGETRSKLFNDERMASSNYVHFSCGYNPTSNNQSFHQEFDIGPVHHNKRDHLKEDGSAKCSRRPIDLYARSGQYLSNRSARRRALANAAEISLQTSIRSAVNSGHTLMYQPSLTNIVSKLSTITRAVTRVA